MTQELWHPIAGYEGLYEVSNLGSVRSLDRLTHHSSGKAIERRRGRVLKPSKELRGYLFVSLCKNGKRRHAKVHHLVAEVFLPPSDKPQINHKDFDKTNNSATNLEWATAKENSHHRLVAEPGLSAAEASKRMEAIYAARAAKPSAVRHPKVKPCAVCGLMFTPPPQRRAKQQTCSKKCAGVISGLVRRKPGSTRFSKYATVVLVAHVNQVQAKQAA